MQRHRLQCGRWQLRKLPVCLDESIERFGTVLNNLETTVEAEYVMIGRIRSVPLQRTLMEPGTKAAGNGLDRRQRVVDFVPDHPDQALEGIALLLAQGNAHVGQYQERVRDAVLTESGSPHHPVHRIAFAAEDEDSPIGLIQDVSQLQIMSARAQVSLRDEMEYGFGGRVDEAQPMRGIEGQYGCIHGRDDTAQ
jgi:hypothetical protein